MDSTANPSGRVVVFDGACGVCTWMVGRARQLDRRGLFGFVPCQDLSPRQWREFGVTPRMCAQRVYLVRAAAPGDPHGPRALGGAFAVNAFLWRFFPWNLVVALIYAVPLLLLLEVVAYRWVARNRAWLSRRLGMDACRITPATGAPPNGGAIDRADAPVRRDVGEDREGGSSDTRREPSGPGAE